jgi:FAS-associated factor 2
LFSWPFNIVWGFSLSIIQLAIRLLHRPSITPPRRDPRSEADRFLREFESNYGTRHPEFFPGGYSQALAKAKEELKYLLVILQSDEHDDTDKFCR